MFTLGQIQGLDATAHERRQGVILFFAAAVVVKRHYILKCLQAAVMHVGLSDLDIAQCRCFEGADLGRIFCDGETSQFRHVFLRQYSNVHISTLAFYPYEFCCSGSFLALHALEADTNIVKAIVDEQCCCLFDAVT